MSNEMPKKESDFITQSPRQFLERRLATIYGTNSMALKALDLVCEEMCVEKGFKRDNGTDYYNHCIEVANTLISYGIVDEDAVCAALLHDFIEDIEWYNRATIARLFNSNVARLVMLVTKKEGLDYKKAENLEEYLAVILSDMYATVIKTADRMHNMMTLEEKTFDSRYRKAIETEKFYLSFFKKATLLYPRYENLFNAARAEIEPLIFHIKSFYNENQRQQEEIKKLKERVTELEKIVQNLSKNSAETTKQDKTGKHQVG